MQPDTRKSEVWPVSINGVDWTVKANVESDQTNMALCLPGERVLMWGPDAPGDQIEDLFRTAYHLSMGGPEPDVPRADPPPPVPRPVTVTVNGQTWSIRPDVPSAVFDGVLLMPSTRELVWTEGLDRDVAKDALWEWFHLATAAAPHPEAPC